jgi:hypothetical protein
MIFTSTHKFDFKYMVLPITSPHLVHLVAELTHSSQIELHIKHLLDVISP